LIILRIVTVLFALALMGGEAYRSWGVERAPLLWIDEMLIGAALITAAVLVGRDSFHRRAFFTAAWGVVLGALYISAFTTWFDAVTVELGGFTLLQMQVLISIACGVAALCLIASIVLPHAGRVKLDVVGEHEFLSATQAPPSAPKPPSKKAEAKSEKKDSDPSKTAAE
jgi:hypothetical protein